MKTHLSSVMTHVFSSIRTPTQLLLLTAAILLVPDLFLCAQDNNGAFLPDQVRSASTVPANGDVNPYGVAFVPPAFPTGGSATPGNILVSNLNNSQNLQGTGTTIVDIPPGGPLQPFFQGPAGLGLTTALNILQKGFVLVGNFPSSDGTCPNSKPGSIQVIDKNSKLLSTISDPLINGPRGFHLVGSRKFGEVLCGQWPHGAVVRLDLSVTGSGVKVRAITQIASGYAHACDPVTFVDAPTGLVYDPTQDILYVASTLDNEVFAVGNAAETNQDRGRGTLVYSDNVHLHGPLGMIQAPNGHLIVSNNDSVNSDPNQPSELVEFTKQGQFVKQISIDPQQGGSFGLAVATSGSIAKLAAVDDAQNILLIWTLP